MMASIPNMRSTPLPVPPGKAGTTEAAPGDFAAQLPLAREQIVQIATPQPQPQPQIAAAGAELVLPELAEAIEAVEGEAPEPTAKPETSETDKAVTPDQPRAAEIVIPVFPTPPAAPSPQVPPTFSADEAPPAEPQTPVVELASGKARRPARAAVAALPQQPVEKAPAAKSDATQPETPQIEPQQVEAAVKDLLQRKQGLAKPVAAQPKGAPADLAKPDATPVQDQVLPQAKAQKQAQSPLPAAAAPAQAAAPLPAVEQPQPMLAPSAPLPATAKTEARATIEGVRTADLAVERQLDLSRDGEWLDRLARDIARAGAADTPLRFRLHPQTLGHLQVELQQGDRGTAVRLTVETEAARQLLADAQPRLAAEARAQGVRIAETHVDLSGSGREAPGDQRRQDEARQTPLIRTARGAGEDAAASARPSSRAGLDRYA